MNHTLPLSESCPAQLAAPIVPSRPVCQLTVGMTEDVSQAVASVDEVIRGRLISRPRRAVVPTVGMVEDMSNSIVAGDAIPVARIRQCARPRRPTPPTELLRLFNHYYQERNMPLALAYTFVAAKCGLKRATVERRHLAALGQALDHLPQARPTNG